MQRKNTLIKLFLSTENANYRQETKQNIHMYTRY